MLPSCPSDAHHPDNGCYFRIDHQGCRRHCTQAKKALFAGDHELTEKALFEALRLQPSSMLAYTLLSQLYLAQGRQELASSCQHGILPKSLLNRVVAGKARVKSGINTVVAAAVSQVDRSVIYSPQCIEVPAAGMPESFQADNYQLINPALADSFTIESAPGFVDCIAGGAVWHDTRHTVVWDASSVEVAEHTIADCDLISAIAGQHHPLHVGGRAFLIGARGAHNFYHWMTDIAPKLGMLITAGFTFETTDRFIVPQAGSDYCLQLMQSFGVTREQVIVTENEVTYLSADQLVVPFMRNRMGLSMGRWVPGLMRSALLQYSPAPDVVDRYLFIDRGSSADGRHIVNQAELHEELIQSGFEIVQTESLSVSEQASLFASAKVVVAAHGAALGNLMFCQPGTVVIELFSHHLAPCYRAISALCDLQYHCLYCGDSNSESLSAKQRRSGSLTVSVPELRGLLDVL